MSGDVVWDENLPLADVDLEEYTLDTYHWFQWYDAQICLGISLVEGTDTKA